MVVVIVYELFLNARHRQGLLICELSPRFPDGETEALSGECTCQGHTQGVVLIQFQKRLTQATSLSSTVCSRVANYSVSYLEDMGTPH